MWLVNKAEYRSSQQVVHFWWKGYYKKAQLAYEWLILRIFLSFSIFPVSLLSSADKYDAGLCLVAAHSDKCAARIITLLWACDWTEAKHNNWTSAVTSSESSTILLAAMWWRQPLPKVKCGKLTTALEHSSYLVPWIMTGI